jgi:hypothetical protein
VASTGGHLAQLHQFRPRLVPPEEKVLWATFDTAQSRSMLVGEHVEYVPYIGPRDLSRVIKTLPRARQILLRNKVDRVISTGAGVALSFLPLARRLGLEVHYIESAARSQGPSTTGRLLQLVPGIRLTSQYETWAGGRWRRGVSVFDDFIAVPQDGHAVERVVVTLGTIEGYHFRSAVERVRDLLPPSVEVLWQTGYTDTSDLGVPGRVAMPQLELLGAMAKADVRHRALRYRVGAHSHAGRAHANPPPPRRVQRGEHVDDHQEMIAQELSGRGLAIRREVDDLRWEDLVAATRDRHRISVPPPETGDTRRSAD